MDDDGTYSQRPAGFIRFDREGEVRCVCSYEIPGLFDSDSIEEMCRHFSEMYFEVPNPFEKGDIVKSHWGYYGIVDESQKEWKEQVEKHRKWEQESRNQSCGDIILWVSVLEEDGTFGTGEADPVDLERYQPENPGSPLDVLLNTASLVTKGECSLSVLFCHIREYKKHLDV